MSVNHGSFSEGLDYLRLLSDDELDTLIRTVSNAEKVDELYLEKLLIVAGEREAAVDVEAAFEEFLRDFSGQQEIYPIDDVVNTTQTIRETERKKQYRRKRLARFSFVAVSFIVLCTVFFTSTAIGASFWQSFAQWTRETFGFAAKETPAVVNAELEGLHEALAEYGITDTVAPTWLPEGFVLTDLTVVDSPKQVTFITLFRNSSMELTVQIVSLNDLSSLDYEKDEGDAYPYKRNNINHYIMTNKGKTNIVWTIGNYECYISGDISEDEAERIINSIYER